MYLSVHQYPFYPGTGAPDEVGSGDGRGATVNVGLPAGCGDSDLLAVFDRVFVPALMHFRPDLVLVSAGFDAHRADPLAGLRVTEAGYRAMAERLCSVADQVAGGRLVALLEGGYDLGALSRSLVAVLEQLDRQAGQGESVAGPAPEDASAAGVMAIARTLEAHHDQPWASEPAKQPARQNDERPAATVGAEKRSHHR
jgi:acetoin utilization deacetylase AcuC-like enzyme